MKTRITFVLSLAAVFTMVACSPKEAPEANEAPATVAAAAPDSAAMAEQAALAAEAKVSEADARATALKEVPSATVDTFELEKEDGKLIYSYDLKVAGKEGIEEVQIDGITGAMVSHVHESPADEAKEAAAETDEASEAGQAALAKQATITETAARATALKAVPGGAFSKMELEMEDGLLVYSYDITITGKEGVEEVKINAKTGKLVSKEHESAADEAKEKAEEGKAATAKKAAGGDL